MLFKEVAFGDPEYDGPYLRANRGDFDGPERVQQQTDFLEQVLALKATDKILDAGCGIGTYTHALAERGFATLEAVSQLGLGWLRMLGIRSPFGCERAVCPWICVALHRYIH